MGSTRLIAVLLAAGAILVPVLVVLVWTLDVGSSEAQQGAMQNCPQAGKWAISVWSGDDGTATDQALATCGVGAVAAAYWLDPETQEWSRYFRGRPEISSLAALNDMQGIIALGGACEPSPLATGTVIHRYEPPATFPDPSTLPTWDLCGGPSISTGRADSYRCGATDPCFLVSVEREGTIVACPLDPRDESTTLFARVEEVKTSPTPDLGEERPWFLVLDAPASPACRFVTGATFFLPRGSQRADFECSGSPDWCVSPESPGSADLMTYCYPGVRPNWSEEQMRAVETACSVSEAWY